MKLDVNVQFFQKILNFIIYLFIHLLLIRTIYRRENDKTRNPLLGSPT